MKIVIFCNIVKIINANSIKNRSRNPSVGADGGQPQQTVPEVTVF